MPQPQAKVEDARFVALKSWFLQQGPHLSAVLNMPQLGAGRWQAAGSDASFRRYFRWQDDNVRLVLMDAPPPGEDCRPFVRMAQMLSVAGLNVPRVLAQDMQQGFLVLSDLGEHTWLQLLNADNADEMFARALDALVQLQQIDVAGSGLPEYDEALLRRELGLFPDWYLQHELGVQLSAEQTTWWQQGCEQLVQAALRQPQVLVHRDYMPRNLMESSGEPGVLDFQDAVLGPISYDVISLFKDAFLSWPEERVHGWLRLYWDKARAAGLPVPESFARFVRDCDWMGLQRHLKVIGIFARICHRDGKLHYLQDVPRFFAYIRPVLARYPELKPLQQLFDSLPLPENCR